MQVSPPMIHVHGIVDDAEFFIRADQIARIQSTYRYPKGSYDPTHRVESSVVFLIGQKGPLEVAEPPSEIIKAIQTVMGMTEQMMAQARGQVAPPPVNLIPTDLRGGSKRIYVQ